MKKKLTGGAAYRKQQMNKRFKFIAMSVMMIALFLFAGTITDDILTGLSFATMLPIAFSTPKGLGKGDPDPDPEPALEIVKQFNLKQQELLKAIGEKASSEDVTKLKNELLELHKTKSEALEDALMKQGEALKKMQDEAQHRKDIQKSFKVELAEAITKNKELFTKIKASKGSFSIDLTSKDITSANFDNITGDAFRVAEIGKVATRQPFLEAIIAKTSQKGDAVKYVDQHSIVRGAAVIDEKKAYPKSTDIQWQEITKGWSKVGDMVTICKDQLEDHDYVLQEIQQLLDVNVNLKVDDQILNGTDTGAEMTGIKTIADEFVAAAPFALAVENPTVYDLIYAISAQLENASFGAFQPNYVLMNPLDVAKMGMDKSSTSGVYQVPPFVTNNGLVIGNMMIITNSNITQNTLIVGDMTKAKLYDRKLLTIEFSTEHASNFASDLVTIKATRRLANIIRNVDANAFVKCTDIATAITAITKP